MSGKRTSLIASKHFIIKEISCTETDVHHIREETFNSLNGEIEIRIDPIWLSVKIHVHATDDHIVTLLNMLEINRRWRCEFK
jgi:hypothetical protein